MADKGRLIAVDWGTSRLRAMLLSAAGRPIATAESADGIGALESGTHEAAFERLVSDWPTVPAIMAGMIGSRQGWREAPYAACPATPKSIAASIIRFKSGAGRPLAIVPGIMVRSDDRDGDVIRGEETQIVGLLADEPRFDGIVVLPGTHSKWATVSEGAITFTRIFGASSAASDRASPSTAPFAAEIDAWNGSPCAAATDENNTTDAEGADFNAGSAIWSAAAAPRQLTRRSLRKSSSVRRWNGLSVMLPGK